MLSNSVIVPLLQFGVFVMFAFGIAFLLREKILKKSDGRFNLTALIVGLLYTTILTSKITVFLVENTAWEFGLQNSSLFVTAKKILESAPFNFFYTTIAVGGFVIATRKVHNIFRYFIYLLIAALILLFVYISTYWLIMIITNK